MISLSEFVRVCYAPTYLYGQVKLRTIDAYMQSVELFLEHVGDLPLNKLTPSNTHRFVQALNKLGLANETIPYRLRCPKNNGVAGVMKNTPAAQDIGAGKNGFPL